MKKILYTLVALFFTVQISFAQEIVLSPTVIASAGGYNTAGDISLSWTLGELAVSTLEQGDMILTQGFQQSYPEIIGFNLDPIDWQIIAYPNPVVENLNIQFDVREPSDFFIEVQDVAGKVISLEQYKEVFPGDIITIEMSSYKYGVYFFRVSTTDREQVRVLSIRKD